MKNSLLFSIRVSWISLLFGATFLRNNSVIFLSRATFPEWFGYLSNDLLWKLFFPLTLLLLTLWKIYPYLFSEKVFILTFALANLLIRDTESSGSFGEHFDVPLVRRYDALGTIAFFIYGRLRVFSFKKHYLKNFVVRTIINMFSLSISIYFFNVKYS